MSKITNLKLEKKSVVIRERGSGVDWDVVVSFLEGEDTYFSEEAKRLEIEAERCANMGAGIGWITTCLIDGSSEGRALKEIISRQGITEWAIEDFFRAVEILEKPQRDKDQKESAIQLRIVAKCANLKYFVLKNRAGNLLHILADSREIAGHIAFRANRISSPDNGTFMNSSLEGMKNTDLRAALESAISAGWPGIIEIIGNNVLDKRRGVIY